jgi:hypothetical protein
MAVENMGDIYYDSNSTIFGISGTFSSKNFVRRDNCGRAEM